MSRGKNNTMLRDLVLCDESMLFRLFVARFLTAAQLRSLCQTSKDFSGTFLLCVLSCRDLVDEQLQHAFVARLVKAKKRALLQKIVHGNHMIIPGLQQGEDMTIALHQSVDRYQLGRTVGCLASGASLSALVFGGAVMLKFCNVSQDDTRTWIQGAYVDEASGDRHEGVNVLVRALFGYGHDDDDESEDHDENEDADGRAEEAKNRRQTTAQLLLLLGADPNARINSVGGQESRRNGSTVLIVAIQEGLTTTAETLVKANADPNLQDAVSIYIHSSCMRPQATRA
jgi:hypothetical protein